MYLGGLILKILYLINYLGGGGTESYIYSLINGLKSTNEIFLVYNEAADGYEKFKDLNINMIQLTMDSFYDLKAAKELKKICLDNSIDLVHTHFLRENSISVLAKFLGNKAKLINTRHMLIENTGLTKLVNKFITKFNDYIIAVSKSVENLLINELGPRENIRLIYTGIDPKTWSFQAYDFRKKYGLKKDTVLIASTARFSKEKGHEFIIRSLAKFKNDLASLDFKFIFIGDGPILEDMVKLSKDLKVYDYILFLGYQRDIKSILAASDIYILASETEAFGISILEAMASKLPIIATNTGGIREIISKDSKEGILVDYLDQLGLKDSLVSLIEDEKLRKSYGQAGYDLVTSKFSLEKTIEETYNLYSN